MIFDSFQCDRLSINFQPGTCPIHIRQLAKILISCSKNNQGRVKL